MRFMACACFLISFKSVIRSWFAVLILSDIVFCFLSVLDFVMLFFFTNVHDKGVKRDQ